MVNSKCKICRRAGAKLFLKGERCFGPKCPMVKRPYPPGQKRKRRTRGLSEYGQQLREKQKLKNWYGLKERQFKKYVLEVLDRRGKEDAESSLIKKLESRLDNVIFRLGLTSSRSQARQLVNHGHFKINSKKVNYPSYQVKKGDVINVSEFALKNNFFKNIKTKLKKYQPPSWLKLNVEKLEGKVIDQPSFEEAAPPAEISAIFEFYSK